MADIQKPVYTSTEIKKQLRESNRDAFGERVWGAAYGAASVGAEKAQGALQQSYREAVANAYDSYLQNRMAITSSNLIGESQETLLDQQQAALTEAYNSYRSNLQEGESEILKGYQQEIDAIDEALTTQAEYTTNYMNRFGDYYTYLTEEYGDALLQDELWNLRFGIDDPEEGRRLSTWNELRSRMYDENEDLTMFGVDVIDQLENAQIGKIINNEEVASWEDYLHDVDEDLVAWAAGYNQYNYTLGGTNAATIKALTGRLSTDAEYSFLERWGGLTVEQSDKLFSRFNETVKHFQSYDDGDKKKNGKSIVNEVSGAVGEIHKFTKDLGIDVELENAMLDAGMPGGFEKFQEDLKAYAKGTKTSGEMAATWFGVFGGSALSAAAAMGLVAKFGGMAAAGASTAALSGTTGLTGAAALSGAGLSATIGGESATVVGAGATGATVALPIAIALVGVFMIGAGIWLATENVRKEREQNKQMANNAITTYKSLVNTLAYYGHEKAVQNQNMFYKN